MNPRDPLSDVLRSWRYQPPPEPGFNAQVWARLEADEPRSRTLLQFPSFARWSLPLAASVAVVVSALLGSTAALAYSSVERDQRMAALYARSIDPLQRAPAAPSGAGAHPHVH